MSLDKTWRLEGPQSDRLKLSRRRLGWWGSGLVLTIALVAIGYPYALQGMAAVLVVEDPLKLAQAIVVLGGQVPFREMEAADLYKAGWAPRVVLIRGLEETEEKQALRELGFKIPDPSELRQQVLIKLGVPSSAILIPEEPAESTLQELQIAFQAIRPGHAPVILVTSKYHGRRTRLTWDYVTAGLSPGIVRPASGDPFDVEGWWRKRHFIRSVIREYLGLVNYWLEFRVIMQPAK